MKSLRYYKNLFKRKNKKESTKLTSFGNITSKSIYLSYFMNHDTFVLSNHIIQITVQKYQSDIKTDIDKFIQCVSKFPNLIYHIEASNPNYMYIFIAGSLEDQELFINFYKSMGDMCYNKIYKEMYNIITNNYLAEPIIHHTDMNILCFDNPKDYNYNFSIPDVNPILITTALQLSKAIVNTQEKLIIQTTPVILFILSIEQLNTEREILQKEMNDDKYKVESMSLFQYLYLFTNKKFNFNIESIDTATTILEDIDEILD